MHIQFDPPFLPLHTALLVVVAAGTVLALYVRRELAARTPRRLALAGLRTLLVLALAFILLNPIVVAGREAPKGKAPFLVLLDTSRSMCTPDVEGGARWAAAKRLTVENRALLADLTAKYDLRFFGFADRPEAASPSALANLTKPNGDRTNLGSALIGAVNAAGGTGRGSGQMLLVSDGRDTSDSFPLEAARAARAQGFEISTLCVGRQTQQRDLQVIARRPQVFASPEQTVQIGAEIRDTGVPRTTERVDLLLNGRRVAAQNVVVEPGRREVSFPVTQAKKGLYRYSIAVAPDPSEQNPANNRASVFLSVMNTRAHVLFLEGRPSWDSKFLSNALRTDPTVTLDVIYKLTDTKHFAVIGGSEKEEGIAIPRTVEQMSKYDLIIFGKGFEEFYDEAGVKTLKEWISERGGNLLFLRGRPDERMESLGEIEPVTWSDQEIDELRMRLTQEGKAHPGFAFAISEDAQTVVKKLPPLVSATRVQGEKALAVVLARAENAVNDQDAKEMATLAYIRYGQGKVMAIVGQGLWRWAFLPPDLESYGKVYEEFWTQTVRWMVSESDFLPGQNISLRTDRAGYAPNETVTFLGYLRGRKAAAPSALTLTRPDGTTTQVGAATGDGKRADFTATYRPTQPGEYIASVPAPGAKAAPVSTVFTVFPGHEEDLNRSADPDLMRQIAATSGGYALAPGDVSGLPERLQAAEQAKQRKTEPRTAWDRPWVLAFLFLLLAAEWWIRRRSGMA
jgi:hypothetical protein